jgi:hypothetical protein
MLSITEQVQNLVQQGNTEQALETFANWLRTEQSPALNEVILLRSRYEKVQQEQGLDLISSEDAARAYNQINFSLLNLVQSVQRSTAPAPSVQQSNSPMRWIVLAGVVLLIAVVLIAMNFFVPVKSSESQATQTSTLRLPQGNKVSLTSVGTTVTYTVLEARTEPYNAENQKVTVKIRALLGKGIGGMNFWESSFRLFVNDLPYAAQGELNELVENESFKDGEVYFLIPTDARQAVLKFKFLDQSSELPVTW